MDQTILVSGALGDIGRAICTRLAQDGSRIIALDLPTPIEHAASFMRSLPGSGHQAIACDLTDWSQIQALADQFNPDIILHAAVDPILRERLAVVSPEAFQNQFKTTLFGGFNLFRAFIPAMQTRGSGKLIALTTAALEPNATGPRMGAYLSAKSALRMLLRELARELAPQNIQVMAVAPDFVPTKLNSDLPPQFTEIVRSSSPTGRLLTPEDVAEVVAETCLSGVSGMSYPVPAASPTTL